MSCQMCSVVDARKTPKRKIGTDSPCRGTRQEPKGDQKPNHLCSSESFNLTLTGPPRYLLTKPIARQDFRQPLVKTTRVHDRSRGPLASPRRNVPHLIVNHELDARAGDVDGVHQAGDVRRSQKRASIRTS